MFAVSFRTGNTIATSGVPSSTGPGSGGPSSAYVRCTRHHWRKATAAHPASPSNHAHAPQRAIKLTAWLNQLPGAILVALVAPAVLAAGFAGVIAGACTALVAARTRNIALALVAGVVALWVMRRIG